MIGKRLKSCPNLFIFSRRGETIRTSDHTPPRLYGEDKSYRYGRLLILIWIALQVVLLTKQLRFFDV